MIQKFYGLRADAFSLSPDLGFLFVSEAHEEAVAHLLYGLEQNEDVILIAGDIGTGKTLALQRLLGQLSNVYIPVTINVTTMGFDEFLRFILIKLGKRPDAAAGLAEMLDAFEEILKGKRAQGQKVLLVVDEAQDMPAGALEGARLLLNLARPGKQVLQLVLAGQLGLRAALARPEMRQLRQRIRVECVVGRLSREEVEAYLRHRLAVAGRRAPLFSADAIDRIYDYSQGVPRVVNHLASKAMVAGYVDEAKLIRARHVEDLDEADVAAAGTVAPPPDDAERAIGALIEPAVARPEPGRQTRSLVTRQRRRRVAIALVCVVAASILAIATYPVWSTYLQGQQWLEPKGERTAVENAGSTDDGLRAVPDEESGVAVAGENPVNEGINVPAADASADSSSDTTSVPSSSGADDPAGATVDSVGQTAYSIHVASFADIARAGRLLDELEFGGNPAYVETKIIDNGSEWHRVYVGPFADRHAARVAAEELMRTRAVKYFQIYEVETR